MRLHILSRRLPRALALALRLPARVALALARRRHARCVGEAGRLRWGRRMTRRAASQRARRHGHHGGHGRRPQALGRPVVRRWHTRRELAAHFAPPPRWLVSDAAGVAQGHERAALQGVEERFSGATVGAGGSSVARLKSGTSLAASMRSTRDAARAPPAVGRAASWASWWLRTGRSSARASSPATLQSPARPAYRP